MLWNVTYRGKDGKSCASCFEADSRNALFKILTEKGISAIRVEEAKKGRISKASQSSHMNSRVAAWVAIGIAVAVGGWFVAKNLPSGEKPNVSQERKQKPRATIPAATPSLPSEPPAVAPEPPKRVLTPEERREGLEAIRNREYDGPVLDMDTYVSPDPGFSNRWERFKAEQAKLPFKYMSENQIAVILDTKPGQMILDTAFHPNFERDFLKSLEEAIIPTKDDDEKTVQLKRDMVQAKIILKEAYDNGESITDILREERANLIKIYTLRDNLFKELKEIEKTAQSSQEIDDFVSAANLMLDEYGAQHIKLPYSRERMRLERAEGLIP